MLDEVLEEVWLFVGVNVDEKLGVGVTLVVELAVGVHVGVNDPLGVLVGEAVSVLVVVEL